MPGTSTGISDAKLPLSMTRDHRIEVEFSPYDLIYFGTSSGLHDRRYRRGPEFTRSARLFSSVVMCCLCLFVSVIVCCFYVFVCVFCFRYDFFVYLLLFDRYRAFHRAGSCAIGCALCAIV